MINETWHAHILNKENLTFQEERLYTEAYGAWHRCWAPIYTSIDPKSRFYADQFTRQDEVLAVFYGDKCAATVFFRETNLSRPYEKDDSYFGPWPQTCVDQLISRGSKVLVCSYFTVMPEFRKGVINVSVKDLLMGLLIRRFLESDMDVMTGSLRNSKGINELCFKWGATLIQNNVAFNNELNDLVGFYHDSTIKNAVPELRSLLDKLWADCTANKVRPEHYKKVS